MDTQIPNPLNLQKSLKRPFEEEESDGVQAILPEDSAVTQAEKVVGISSAGNVDARDKIKGIALVKAE